MHVFKIDDPNAGFGSVMEALSTEGIRTDSRNGPVIRFPKPVCLEYTDPRRRIIDHPVRDANPFFHLFETMWMLAGLRSVEPLNLYNSGMKNYSDDGVTFAAAYGYRWRHHFGFDQLATAVQKLQENPQDRRIVIQMWDPQELRKKDGKDFACNQQILLDTRPLESHTVGVVKVGDPENKKYALDMTVTNRSNDLIYGAMGSNLFHFSLLHEYLARHSGLEVGTYYHISKNMHLYLENDCSKRCWERRGEFRTWEGPSADYALTAAGLCLKPEPIKHFVETHQISEHPDNVGTYLDKIVKPVTDAYRIYKLKSLTGIEVSLEKRVAMAKEALVRCCSMPLRVAGERWMDDKLAKHRTKTMGESGSVR